VPEEIETASYLPADPFFGAAYVDVDEGRDQPYPHRHVHGGFEGTDTRFTFYFVPAEEYQGRLFHPLEGGHAGHEEVFGSPMMAAIGNRLEWAARLGGYMVESNCGHIGDEVDPKAGDDPTVYGHRASIESARFSKHVAAQVYGSAPHHAYVYGGSGGARRSPLCLEYGAHVYDGAMPYMGGGNVEPHGTTSRVQSDSPISFGAMFNVQRVLGSDIALVVDAMAPGGSGDPFVGLTVHQAEELAYLYQQGFPRGDEHMIANPLGQMWLWTSIADMLLEDDAEYFERFWTARGYVGHDQPELVGEDLIDVRATVTRVITARDLLEDPVLAGAEYDPIRRTSVFIAQLSNQLDLPLAVELDGLGSGYRMGTGVRVLTGAAAGRSLYCSSHGGEVLACDGRGDANILRFAGVAVGDEVQVDNRAFLAFCYYYRHHQSDSAMWDFLRVDGRARYPQHGVPVQSPLMGVPYSGQYEGKLLWIHHTHDASLWPPQGVIYADAVLDVQGAQAAAEKFCIRWSENAEHGPPGTIPSAPNRANSTWLIDTMPIVEQSLWDLVDWCENGIKPAATRYEFAGGRVTLPRDAAQRGGIQPVVAVTADGGARAEVRIGQPVTLEVRAEVPPGAGAIVDVAWDFEGQATFPFHHDGPFSGGGGGGGDASGSASAVRLSTTHTYDEPGTYFVTALVHSHRDGDAAATTRRIPNLASARVVVS
jgi:hypothetical protein